jgi:hypothetical protein
MQLFEVGMLESLTSTDTFVGLIHQHFLGKGREREEK